MGGTRDGHRDATGGAWPNPDSASRCPAARWEISYIPYTCVTCRLHVRLHAMTIVTRQVVPHMAGFRAGRHPHGRPLTPLRRRRPRLADGRSASSAGQPPYRTFSMPIRQPAHRTVAARHASRSREALPPGRPCPASAEADESCGIHARNPSAGRGRVSAWRTPIRRVEPNRSRARPTGSSETAKAVKPAYPLSYNGAGEGVAPAPPSNPPRVALPWRSRMGAPPPSPVSVRRDA